MTAKKTATKKPAKKVVVDKVREQLKTQDIKEAKQLALNEPKDLGGRPLKPITHEQVYDLALIHCTVNEMAAVLHCSHELLYDRFSEAMRIGRENGKMSLKRKMFQKALDDKGDTSMLIWLSKQHLGYRDKQEEEAQQINFNIQVMEVPK